VLVDGTVHVPPCAGDLLGLIDEPPVADGVAAWPGRVDDQRREALHPPVQGDVVDVDAALGQELLESRYDNPYRRYQRTARRITSGGNWKPENAEPGWRTGRSRR